MKTLKKVAEDCFLRGPGINSRLFFNYVSIKTLFIEVVLEFGSVDKDCRSFIKNR